MKKIFAPRSLFFGTISSLLLLASCSHLDAPVLKPAAPPAPIPKQEAALVPEAKADSKMFVEDMLVSKGLRREKVHAYMSDPRVTLSSGIIISNLFYNAPAPSAKNPKVMDVDPRYIGKGVTFIDEHAAAFEAAEQRYKVSPEVITAILIIETNLGKYPMKYNVFRVYASLTNALDTEYLDGVLKPKGEKYALTEQVLKSARSKGNWGLGELAALIQFSEKLGIDPVGINGSFAGALGPAQFIPTSWVRFGVDGNNDGKIDPFEMDDCIASVANYLKLAGWKEEADLKVKRQAIWTYNHHDVYVNTVMMLYDKLIAAGEEIRMPDMDQAPPATDGGAAKGVAPVKGSGGPVPLQPAPAKAGEGAGPDRAGDAAKKN